jgi:hypothetical protein
LISVELVYEVFDDDKVLAEAVKAAVTVCLMGAHLLK